MKVLKPVVSAKVINSAMPFLVSIAMHLSLFLVLSYMTFEAVNNILPVEVSLAPEKDALPPLTEKEKQEIMKSTVKEGVKNPLIETKDKVPVVKQEMPNMAKGEKPVERANIKDKGPVGKEFSNEGSPKGADEGYTWGGENMKMAPKITPQTRISKDKSFSVKGEAQITVQADEAHFHFYLFGDESEVSEQARGLGQINAIRWVDNSIEMFKRKFSYSFHSRLKYIVNKDGDPDMQFATVYVAASSKDAGGPASYIYVARQKIILTCENKYLDEIARTIATQGASFSPINKPLYRFGKTIVYDKELLDSDGRGKSNMQETEDPEIKAAKIMGQSMGKALKNDTDLDDDSGVGGMNSYMSFSLNEANKKKAEEEVFKLALADAKKKATIQSRELGLPIEGISPLIERTVSYKAKKDLSGAMIYKGFIILYY